MLKPLKKIISSREFILLIIIVAIFIFLCQKSEFFLTANNLNGVLGVISVNTIIAIGMTILIISGGFDMSVGTHLSFLGIILGILLASGINIVIAILLTLVLGWRESLIVTFTVPAILAITLFVAYLTGQTINRITLFAFLLSLGLLVDAAIIVIENIHRHYHDVGAADRDADELMIEATDEIGPPTNIATLAIILTMVPMAFVGGMMGQFMKPIPANVPVSLIASLFVAYIFTPYLAVRLLKKPEHHDGGEK